MQSNVLKIDFFLILRNSIMEKMFFSDYAGIDAEFLCLYIRRID